MLVLVLTLTAAVPLDDDAAVYRAIRAYDQRVTDVGERLASRAGDLCSRTVLRTGIAVHDRSNYPKGDQGVVTQAFGLDARPQVLAVAKGSAAEAADLRPGDAIVAIDGAPPAAAIAEFATPQRSEAVLAALNSAAAAGRVTLRIARDGADHDIAITPRTGCATRFYQRSGTGADGSVVTIDSDMIALADSDDELAALVAHELAHNILRHQERLGESGASMGLLASFGRSGRLIRQTEREADRLSVYLVERAGYDLNAIEPMWRKLAKLAPVLRAPTHGGMDQRIAAMRAERARIAGMRARGESPRPDFYMQGVTGLPTLK